MNCPVCISVKLTSVDLESDLSSLSCTHCSGNWIAGSAYWKWLEQKGTNLPEIDDAGTTLTTEPDKYLDCPECRFRMIKCLVGRGLSFSLDHCQGCKGIWLDRNEWETLKRRNLHDDLNSMLTYFWQAQARKEARRKNLEQIYVARFGVADYAEIKRVRTWLDANRNKQHLLAYLTDADPFDV